MKNESKLWIYFLLHMLEQLETQAQEMPSLLKFSVPELKALKDELFALTIEQTIDGNQLSNQELQKELLYELPVFLDDTKRFPLKKDLIQFAEQLGVHGLKTSRTKAHIIGTLCLEIKNQDRAYLERLLKLMQGDDASNQENHHQPTQKVGKEDNFTWFDFMESVKK